MHKLKRGKILNGQPQVSVLVPCLLLQSYKNLQIIFVNDGSTDESEQIVNTYRSRFDKQCISFKYLYQKNQGAASAINNALKYVTGKYIILYDVDDILYRDAIWEKVYCLETFPSYSIVYNNGYYVNSIDEFGKNFFTRHSLKGNIFKGLIKGKVYNWPGSYMVRTATFFQKLGPSKNIYISPFGQNLQFVLPMSYNEKVYFLNKPLMHYYVRQNSHSHQGGLKEFIQRGYGYEENYVQIIQGMALEENEKEKYLQLVKNRQENVRIKIALRHKNKEIFNAIIPQKGFRKYFYKLQWLLTKIGVYKIYNALIKVLKTLFRRSNNYLLEIKLMRKRNINY